MAEGTWEKDLKDILSSTEEGYIREVDEQGDADQQLILEKELAAQRLWQSFQESATTVAYLFKDVQERGSGGSFWIPFHESASAVTQLYRGAAEVCRQCVESGVRYGQRKKNRELIAWAKKKRRHIKREELLSYAMDKPDPASSQGQGQDTSLMEEGGREHSPMAAPGLTSACFGNGSSPRRRVMCREDVGMGGGDCGEVFSSPRDQLPRKRPQPSQFSFDPSHVLECPPFAKRIRF